MQRDPVDHPSVRGVVVNRQPWSTQAGGYEVIPGPRETRRPECRFERCEGCGALVSATTATTRWPFHERWRRPLLGQTFTRTARVHDPDRCRWLRACG